MPVTDTDTPPDSAALRSLLEARYHGLSAQKRRAADYLLENHETSFSLMGRRAQPLLRDTLSLGEQVESLPPRAVVLAIAFPRYSRQTLEAAERARQRGLSVLALTDGLRSPLAPLAEASLFARSENV